MTRAASVITFALAFVPSLAVSPAVGQSLPVKLATIDGNGYADNQDVKRFRALLPALTRKYQEDENRVVSDISVKGWEIANERGVDVSLRRIMEGMNRAAPVRGSGGLTYRNAVTMYVIFRSTESLTHKEAVRAVSREM